MLRGKVFHFLDAAMLNARSPYVFSLASGTVSSSCSSPTATNPDARSLGTIYTKMTAQPVSARSSRSYEKVSKDLVKAMARTLEKGWRASPYS